MNTLTKMALGLIGHLNATSVRGDATSVLDLPVPKITGGLPLMQALAQRQSQRDFDSTPLPMQTLSDLLWSAAGINRQHLGGRTAPSAMNSQEIDVYAALPGGLYCYAPKSHVLQLIGATDVRRVTGYQDFVDTAPLDLVFVADLGRMKLVPATQREAFASSAAGAMAQNVYLFCASAGLAAVIRAWIDRGALARAMGLSNDQHIILAQTVGHPSTNALA